MFNVGDIITGIDNNHYSYTSSKALMLVIKTYSDMMRVLILYHDKYRYEIGSDYEVDNSSRKFEYTTFEEFEEKYPDCHKMDDYHLNDLISQYDLKIEPKNVPSVTPYILSDEMRKELLEEMRTLLIQYHYHPTDEGLNKILDEWCRNKADLIRLFEKHPNYNGKFQIVFDHDFDRNIDKEAIYSFANWLMSSNEIQNAFKKEVKIGVFSYGELKQICNKLGRLKDYFDDSDIKTINGKTRDDIRSEYRHFKIMLDNYRCRDDVFCDNFANKAYDKKLYSLLNKLDRVDSILRASSLRQFIDDDGLKNYINKHFPEAKVKKGQKTSRVINKILSMLGVDKLPNYNKEFAKFADAINPLKIKRHTVISIHPVDYYTMSFGNSWASCHTIDKLNDRHIDGEHNYRGCNSSGTESYMLDGTSCVFYTVRSEYDGNTLELEDKINRCMFHYYDNRLVQGRVYPQSNDYGANNLYKDIREIAQKVFADLLEAPNYWTNKVGCESCEDAISSCGTHYLDYSNYSTCNISTLKDERDNHKLIHIGHNPICPHCGKMHDREDNIECNSCN